MVTLLVSVVFIGGCIQPNWKDTTTPVKPSTPTAASPLQLTDAEWASAKEFKDVIKPGCENATKQDLYSVAGLLYGISETLTSDSTFKYNVQIDDFRIKCIAVRFNGKDLTTIIPTFLSVVKGKFDYLTPGDAPLTDINKTKAISDFKVLAGGVYLAAEEK